MILSGLAIGSLTLTPTFDSEVTSYAATTNNASNKVTATADEDFTIEIKNGTTAVTNGQNASWSVGENTLKVTVSLGAAKKEYTVVVTRSGE